MSRGVLSRTIVVSVSIVLKRRVLDGLFPPKSLFVKPKPTGSEMYLSPDARRLDNTSSVEVEGRRVRRAIH